METVRVSFLAPHLMTQRWPASSSIDVRVPEEPERPLDIEWILGIVMREIVAMWPSRVYWVVQIGTDEECTYLQGQRRGAVMQVELGEHWHESATDADWVRAAELGWMNPATTPYENSPHVTRAHWANNPVLEVDTSQTPSWQIADSLATTVSDLLNIDNRPDVTVRMWLNADDAAKAPTDPLQIPGHPVRVPWRGGPHPFGSYTWKHDIDGGECLLALDGVPDGVTMTVTDPAGQTTDVTNAGESLPVYVDPKGPGWYFPEGHTLRFTRGNVVVEATTR